MINLIHADLYKIRKSIAFRVCLLVTIICSILLTIISHGLATGDMDIAVNTVSGLSDIFIMSVIGSLMAGISICSDFDSKNIHDAISCGRAAIVSSKIVVYSLIIMILVLPYAICGFVGFAMDGTFSNVLPFSTYTAMMANAPGLAIDVNGVLKALAVCFTSLLLYAARLSFCVPIAFKVRKSVVVMVIGVVFGFLVDLIINVLSKVEILEKLLKLTPFTHINVALDCTAGDLVKDIIISIVFIAIMGIITWVGFRKAEIK